MAGSYQHVVTGSGKLRNSEGINSMLECNSGDVVECVEEMYGMIWWLASTYAADMGYPAEAVSSLVEQANKHYKTGLAVSPGQQEEK